MRFSLLIVTFLLSVSTPSYADDSCGQTKALVIAAKRAIDGSFQQAGAPSVDIKKISDDINNSSDIADCSEQNLKQLMQAMEEFKSTGM